MVHTLMEVAASVARGDVSPSELVAESLARIDELNPALNSFVASAWPSV